MSFLFEKYIYQKQNSLSTDTCKTIIEYFEQEEGRYIGGTASGINVNVKDTTDYLVPLESFENENDKWHKICKLLNSQLQENINTYMKELKSHPQLVSDNYRFLNVEYLTEDTYQIQKYEKEQGKYVYHHDFNIDWDKKRYRVITFLWYLNDISEGGETEIMGDILVKPQAGKLLLFPACWTFPHRGKVPISDDKYIVTGWFYIND
jgi:hypothetical protein